MWDFKGKNTNISPLYPNNPNKISKKPSVISGDYQNIKSPSKIRFRYLSGTYTSDSQEAASSTSSIIWDGVGIGQTVFKYKTIISGNTVDLENTSMDFSYTYGDEYTLTLGSSTVSSGELIVITSDSEIYTSSTVFGYGYFSILGIEFGIFEILLGYKYIRYAFTDLESNTTTSLYMSSFDDSGSLYLLGIGIVF
jgi:NDP-sugar pyrophosphorylase family protein